MPRFLTTAIRKCRDNGREISWLEIPGVGWVADHVDDGTRCDHALDLESVDSSDFQDEEVST